MLDEKLLQGVLKPVIIVCGVGGGGSNAVNNMIRNELEGAKFVVANTDAQSIKNSLAQTKIQLGLNITKGLGAGSVPSVGASAADESREEIKKSFEGANMVFITAGMGGGTGTGSAPVIAKIARDMGILTVGVVTKPFDFEGVYRMHTALKGIEELKNNVDTLIVIPNQNLFRLANENTTFLDAFKMSDEVLNSGVKSITDLVNMPGLINLDFADIKTIMSGMGTAVMGTGEASDEDRAITAARAAVTNPLLSHSSIHGAKSVLVNVTGGLDITLHEVDAAANHIRESVDNEHANIIFGSAFDDKLNGIIRVSVIATGIATDIDKDSNSDQKIGNKSKTEPLGPNSQNRSKFLGKSRTEYSSNGEDISQKNALHSDYSENLDYDENVDYEVPTFLRKNKKLQDSFKKLLK